jgi:hypothetical protein
MASFTGDIATMSADESRRQLRRAVIASTVGTAIEWYDFFLYSIVTGLIFAKLYFPKSDPLVCNRRLHPCVRSAQRGRSRLDARLHEQGHFARV